MSTRLLNDGRELWVYDRSNPAVEALVKRGARGAPSAAEVASAADTVFLSLPTPDIVHAVEPIARLEVSAGYFGSYLEHLSRDSVDQYRVAAWGNRDFSDQFAGFHIVIHYHRGYVLADSKACTCSYEHQALQVQMPQSVFDCDGSSHRVPNEDRIGDRLVFEKSLQGFNIFLNRFEP